MKVGAPPTKSFEFLKNSLFASYLTDSEAKEVSNEGKEEEEEEEIKVSDIVKFNSDDQKSRQDTWLKSSEMSLDEIELRYGGVFLNYYYELFLPDLNSLENIFLYPDMDKPVKEVSEKRIHVSSCQLYVTTKLVHFSQWYVY